MKKNPFTLIASLLFVPLFFLGTACQGSEERKQPEPVPQQAAGVTEEISVGTCGPLVIERCEKCHYLTRVCQNLDLKKKRHWNRTVNSMAKYGARKGVFISEDEQEKIVDCLSSKDPEITAICEEYR